MSNPTWIQVATRPKWILSLSLALLVAAAFGLLGQWQLDRTFRVVEQVSLEETPVELQTLATPGEPSGANAFGKIVSQNLQLDIKNVFLIADRVQLVEQESVSGYWVVANSFALLESGEVASLTVALGFAQNLESAEKARSEVISSILPQAFLPVTGSYLPSEAPVDRPEENNFHLLGSLSLAQLVNLYSFDVKQPPPSFAGFLVLDNEPEFGLGQIVIGQQPAGVQINWLTLFYALEWTVFAGFAVFLWWRLVEDQRVREQEE
jgi:surfeit locus 1 family protein